MIHERGHAWIYDLTPTFDGKDYIYIDFCHVTKQGNQLVADTLTQVLLKHP
jgi:hypothetical protein